MLFIFWENRTGQILKIKLKEYQQICNYKILWMFSIGLLELHFKL